MCGGSRHVCGPGDLSRRIYMRQPGDLSGDAHVQGYVHLQTDYDMRGPADVPRHSVV
jgi:hypothetical protein